MTGHIIADINNTDDGWVQVTLSGDNIDGITESEIEWAMNADTMRWSLISTAPRDGTSILVWRPREDDDNPAGVGIDHWSQRYEDWYRSRPGQRPTHWMPLPGEPTP